MGSHGGEKLCPSIYKEDQLTFLIQQPCKFSTYKLRAVFDFNRFFVLLPYFKRILQLFPRAVLLR